MFTSQAEEHQIRVSPFAVSSIREVSNEHWTKPVRLLAPTDAAEIYRLLHHGPTMVVAFTSVFVRRNPRSDPLTRKQAIPLSQYVAHKALFSLIHGRTDIPRTMAEFDAWRHTTACDGQDDPRVLPLHSFSTTETWQYLDQDETRARFAKVHGPGRIRTDSDNRRWERASAPHGREVLTVAGADLPEGMHWDVQFLASKDAFCCSNEIWSVPRGCHVNVYPDGHVRGKPGKGHAKRVWPRKRP
jgi:hypothetical protein